MRFRLERVHYIPRDLEPGVLYVSEEFSTAAHLCACGCRKKVRTPLGPTEWSIQEDGGGPSLWPSVGNWQHACRSHYVIENGAVVWCEAWTPEEVVAGRLAEGRRRRAYYNALPPPNGPFRGLWSRLREFLRFAVRGSGGRSSNGT
jgi:hypothetical protein